MSRLRDTALIACLLMSALSAASATQASERESESVEVTFYMLSSSEWSSVVSAFKTMVAAQAATYCASNSAECGLDSGFLFIASDVGVYSGPTEDSKSSRISFYIDFPIIHVVSNSSTTSYVIKSETVTTILTNIRESLETAVGHDITYIGDEFYSIEPDSMTNKIVIPIAFIVLIAMIILTISLHMWSKRREKDEKKKQRALEREKRKNRITPIVTITNEKNRFAKRFRKKRTVNGASVGRSPGGYIATLSMKTNMMTYEGKQPTKGADHAPENPAFYEEQIHRNNTLPPLPNPSSGDEAKKTEDQKKQEKKDKRRKKREKRRREEGREESETEVSKTESLEKSGENVVPVEDDGEIQA